MDAPFKLIAFASYTTVGGSDAATQLTFVGRNCSIFWNAPGDVRIRVGTPGPLSNTNVPANLNTEWARAIGNVFPVIVIGTAATSGSVVQTNSTTYQITTWDLVVPGAAESAIWFGLFSIAV